MLILLHAGGGVHLHAQLLKQLGKASHQHLIPGHNPQLQLFPVPFVDVVVTVQNLFRRFYAEIPNGFAQGDTLGLVKIQDGVS